MIEAMQALKPRTPEEAVFLARLLRHRPHLDCWRHTTPDGKPWLIVSRDFVENNVIHDTLRLDFDGRTIKGGWSPAFLNWDDGVPATEAGIDLSPPDGIDLTSDSVEQLAITAAAWFRDHESRWWLRVRG